jgi:hypothetical protein
MHFSMPSGWFQVGHERIGPSSKFHDVFREDDAVIVTCEKNWTISFKFEEMLSVPPHSPQVSWKLVLQFSRIAAIVW